MRHLGFLVRFRPRKNRPRIFGTETGTLFSWIPPFSVGLPR
ncbi:hypothetical protein HMPREF7215_2750 [Pyramidobacter piscolens W5455]|uniref:Uncharacterized protein n=1 Tax=Pyramidobacter piscolens W5455 TaxID=352165 RepID=A0ABM9ZWQ5_9BACT|nr:hypothetical protein HMPREF7215_2750 [Pyramidobacter piscolens W5455]